MGCGKETNAQTCQEEALTINTNPGKDQLHGGFHYGETSSSYAHHSVGGRK